MFSGRDSDGMGCVNFGGNVPLLERHGIVIALEPDGHAAQGAATRAPAVRALIATHLLRHLDLPTGLSLLAVARRPTD